MDLKTLRKFELLFQQLQQVEEESEEWYAISDEICSLPGCPTGTDEEEDDIEIILVSKIQTGYTGEPKIKVVRD
jgi:hypothetical protein